MRVVRCFAFLDLCGFTAYTDQHGDAAAVAVLARLRSSLRAEAEERVVRVTKWLGDGAMLSGIDSAAVMACSAAVRDAIAAEGPLALRGGIAEGAVIMFEGEDYIGASVNLAARLCAAAKPGQILVAANGPARASGRPANSRCDRSGSRACPHLSPSARSPQTGSVLATRRRHLASSTRLTHEARPGSSRFRGPAPAIGWPGR